jgi:uncharacterized protein (TIGR02466 family)
MEKSVDIYTLVKIDVIKGFLTNINNNKIFDTILKYSDQHLSTNIVDTHYEDTFCPDFEDITNITLQIIDAFERVYTNLTLELEDKWAHIHKPNMSTNTHKHCANGFSAVYYVNVDNKSGKICFEYSPTLDMECIDKCFDPTENMFLLFPGFLSHRVTRNLSTLTRISISFNFKVKQKIK